MSARRELLERLAALAAEQAAVLSELAALEDGAPAAPPPRRSKPRLVRVVPSPPPAEPVDEVARMRGKKIAGDILRQKGIPV